MPNKTPKTGNATTDELYTSIRLLLRHCISSQQVGGGVSPTILMEQMQKLDKAFGRSWEVSAPGTTGYARRTPRKRL